MKFSIIIPTFNRKEHLKKTVETLLHQSYDKFELIIADDGSSDGTELVVSDFKKRAWFPVKYFWQKNSGRSAARNLGIKNSECDIVIFVDDHIILQKDFIYNHLKAYQKHCNKGPLVAVRGRSILVNKPEDAFSFKGKLPLFKIDKRRIQDPFYTFITNNLSVKKAALEEVGGFDEDFKNYGFQDSELGYRLKKAGYSFKWQPEAVGFIFSCGHKEGAKWERAYQVGLSANIFAKKHPEARFKVGVNLLNKLFYFLFRRSNERKIKKWIKKKIFYSEKNNFKKADFYSYWIKHYYFCKGIFSNA